MVGNDVVDLGDPEARAQALHPRFDRRVFTPAERASIRRAPAPTRIRWTLWAAKEAVYKVAVKLDPKTIFAPSRFAVHLFCERRATVSHADRDFAVRLTTNGAAIHAVAAADSAREAWIATAVEETPDPRLASRAVRALAVRVLAERLGVDSERLSISMQARIPRAELRGSARRFDLSLSHHGRFVAVACDAAGSGR
jgi:phosphopantetheinyl transferase (holo-ACP synthase)